MNLKFKKLPEFQHPPRKEKNGIILPTASDVQDTSTAKIVTTERQIATT